MEKKLYAVGYKQIIDGDVYIHADSCEEAKDIFNALGDDVHDYVDLYGEPDEVHVKKKCTIVSRAGRCPLYTNDEPDEDGLSLMDDGTYS